MKKSILIVSLTLTVAMAASMFIIACGGGGGGGGENVTYEGSTMPSVIDTTGAVELAMTVVMTQPDPESMVPLSVDTVRVPSDPMAMVTWAKSVLAGASVSGAVQPLAVAEPLAYECLPAETQTDGSGGSRTYQLCGNESTGFMRITLSADSFNDGFESMDGVIIIEGTEGPEGTDITVIFRDYYYADLAGDSEDFYADGIITLVATLTSETTTWNLSIYDFLTDEGFWLNNYKMVDTWDDVAEEDTVTISGRFYDYYGGYVDISTTTPVVIPLIQDNPVSGEIQLTGAMGYWIKLRFDMPVATPLFQVEVNFDADPEYDWQSEWLEWPII
ncbi:hypothetical protein MUP29_08370 [bacterium]|nr:hypothetical protein [bacterium]